MIKKILIFLAVIIVLLYAVIAVLYFLNLGGSNDTMTLEYRFVDQNSNPVNNNAGNQIISKQTIGLYYNKDSDENETKAKNAKLKGANTFNLPGYTFVGWVIDGIQYNAGDYLPAGIVKPADGILVAYPVWAERLASTITFDPNGGTGGTGTQSFLPGDTVTLAGGTPVIPNDFVHSNIGGNDLERSQVFKCWNTAKNGGGQVYNNGSNYKFNGNITLYAQYENAKFTVYFYSNYGGADGLGSIINTKNVVSGTSQLLSGGTPTRSGYTFLGWSLDDPDATTAGFQNNTYVHYYNNDYNDPTTVINFYAVWAERVSTVTFNMNGGQGSNITQAYPYNVSAVLNAVTPTIAMKYVTNNLYSKSPDPQQNELSQIFLYWTTNPNGTGTKYYNDTSYTFANDITLYAHYEAVKYSVSFNNNHNASGIGNGTVIVSDKMFTSGIRATLYTGSDPTWAGHTFEGWSMSADALNDGTKIWTSDTLMNFFDETPRVYDGSNSTVPVTLYAIWS